MEAPETALQIKAFFAAIAAFGTALFGWVGWVVIIWAAAIVLDYLTGTFAAIKDGDWSSKVAREGLWHKVGTIAAVLVSALCDIAINVIISGAGGAQLYDIIHTDTIFTPIVLVWYILTEAGSIIENADKLGAPIPEFLKKRLAKIKNSVEASAGTEG